MCLQRRHAICCKKENFEAEVWTWLVTILKWLYCSFNPQCNQARFKIMLFQKAFNQKVVAEINYYFFNLLWTNRIQFQETLSVFLTKICFFFDDNVSKLCILGKNPSTLISQISTHLFLSQL